MKVTLINIKGENMTIGDLVANIITGEIGLIEDIYLTDRGYAVKLQNGKTDYAHRFVNSK